MTWMWILATAWVLLALALAFALEIKGFVRATVIGPGTLVSGLGRQRGGRSGGGAWSAG